MRKIISLAAYAAIITLICYAVCYADSYGIILPDKPSRTVEHAGKELQKYLSQMTKSYVTMSEEASTCDTVFLLDVSGSNAASTALNAGESMEWASKKSTDAYFLRSIRKDGKNYVILSGKSDPAVLYAVYEYLERYGGCGFFEDGDYVPSKAPKVTAIDYLTSPRFSLRNMRGDVCGAWGMKKFHCFHWKEADWMRFYDWMAKRRLNASDYWPLASGLRAGVAVEMAFGVKDDKPGESYGQGWPNGFSWPAGQRTHILQHRLGYHRMLGIKSIIQFMYGLTPEPFKESHPELKWVPMGYGHAMIQPDEQASYDYSKKFLQAIVDLYGTDHYFNDTPYAEFLGADNYDKSLQLKIAAAQKDCKLFKEIDPEAKWISDSWDISYQPNFWTTERKQKYFESVPNDMLIFFDATTDMNSQYASSNYFFGVPWGVGVLHSFQGDDHLHGNLQELIDRMQKAADDPKSDKLTAYFNIPELHGADMLFWQLSTELAWNPKGVTVDGFVSDYTLRRYGEASYPTMLKAQKNVVKSVYSGSSCTPIYKKLGSWAYTWFCPIWEDNYKDSLNHVPGFDNGMRLLKGAIETALTQADVQKGNSLYENDLVEWTKAYLQHIFNYSIIKSYHAFKQGNAKELERHSTNATKCLLLIEDILSTRPDYYLQNTIDQAMSVPGTNPATPKMIKQNCIIDLYAANDCYEQMRIYYRPRSEIYFNGLNSRLKKGEKSMLSADISTDLGKVEQRWLNEPVAVPASEHFKGTTVQAIQKAMVETRDMTSNWRKGN